MIRVIFEGLVKNYGAVAAVDRASLEIRPGELTYILGPKGAGKSTLARILAGLEPPDDGEIYMGDRMVQSLPAKDRRVGMVFEDLGLWPGVTVVDHVGLVLKPLRQPRAERKRRVAEAMTALRIDSLASRLPHQLSPVQRLRVALARAIVTSPEFLILDQPLCGLDERHRQDFWDDLRRIYLETEVTTLVLTDDPAEALALADRLAVIDLGRIVQSGLPRELYNRPVDVFVARLLGGTNLLQGQVESDRIDARGEVVVRTPLGRLIGQCHPAPPPANTPVTISVRPETLGISLTIPPGWNRFPATVERIVFRGDLRQIHARGPGDWPITISAFQNQSHHVREGQSLTISVAPEHVVVLPGKFAVGAGH
jgi:ABC-type Fe3+/spermidine/putrescine transport system ATPase subunit